MKFCQELELEIRNRELGTRMRAGGFNPPGVKSGGFTAGFVGAEPCRIHDVGHTFGVVWRRAAR